MGTSAEERGLPRPSPIPTPRAAFLLHKPAQIHRACIAGSDFAVLGAADADALLEAGIQLLAGLRVGDIDHVVLVDGDAARAAELSPLGEEFPVLIEDLDAAIGAVGDEQPP